MEGLLSTGPTVVFTGVSSNNEITFKRFLEIFLAPSVLGRGVAGAEVGGAGEGQQEGEEGGGAPLGDQGGWW